MARRLAVELITAVTAERRPFDESFDRLTAGERFLAMEPRDRAFARAIAATTLRRKGQLAEIVKHFIEKPLPERRGRLDAILLSAAAQLVFLKAPPHAVINLAVFQVREDAGARRFSRLANAVLRRISEQGAAIALEQDAGRLNTPDWLWQSWSKAYGAEEAARIAAQHLGEPPLDLTVKSDAEGWARRLGGVVLPTGSVRLAAKGRIEDLDGFAEGDLVGAGRRGEPAGKTSRRGARQARRRSLRRAGRKNRTARSSRGLGDRRRQLGEAA